jgi:hypothetical protein
MIVGEATGGIVGLGVTSSTVWAVVGEAAGGTSESLQAVKSNKRKTIIKIGVNLKQRFIIDTLPLGRVRSAFSSGECRNKPTIGILVEWAEVL